ncbi:MAG: hypothetical protein JF602_05915 [Gemmatimonadetes bacterium]|nr:hypothetical protein [Gemmatimonadota bacterium]
MRQLRDQPTRAVDAAGLPAVWRDSLALRLRPDWPLHDLSDSIIDGAMNGYVVPDRQRIALGPLERTLDRGAFLYPSEIVSLSIIQRNVGRRPITWSITAGRGYAGLGDYVVQAGLGFSLGTLPPDSGDTRLDFRRLASAPLDVSVTQRLVFGSAGVRLPGAGGPEGHGAGAPLCRSPFAQPRPQGRPPRPAVPARRVGSGLLPRPLSA